MAKLVFVFPGDILPAEKAIEMIPEIDLGPTIEIPAIPAEANPDNISKEERQFFCFEIKRLKKEKNALILAHNYEPPDVQDVADFIGDSLHLAQIGRDSNADILVEASVLFMNQILTVMKEAHQKVLAPSLKALCSLAAHADVNKVLEWKHEHPKGKIISTDNLWLMMGACHVHEKITAHDVMRQMALHPDAAVVAHMECGCVSKCMTLLDQGLVTEQMMQLRSTWGMIEFLKKSPQKKIIVATTVTNIYPMQIAAPDKIFIPANPNARCAFMEQNTLRNLYESLRDMKHEIIVDPELARQARIPIEKMLAIQ